MLDAFNSEALLLGGGINEMEKTDVFHEGYRHYKGEELTNPLRVVLRLVGQEPTIKQIW
jgi:hypothetical protein